MGHPWCRETPVSQTAVRLIVVAFQSGTKINLFEILSNQTEIRLYLSFSDCFGTKRASVRFQITPKLVNTTWFQFDLIRLGKDFLVRVRQWRVNLFYWTTLSWLGTDEFQLRPPKWLGRDWMEQFIWLRLADCHYSWLERAACLAVQCARGYRFQISCFSTEPNLLNYQSALHY